MTGRTLTAAVARRTLRRLAIAQTCSGSGTAVDAACLIHDGKGGCLVCGHTYALIPARPGSPARVLPPHPRGGR